MHAVGVPAFAAEAAAPVLSIVAVAQSPHEQLCFLVASPPADRLRGPEPLMSSGGWLATILFLLS